MKMKTRLPFKTIGHVDLIFHVHIPQAYVRKYMCAKYEVFMIKPVASRTVHRP